MICELQLGNFITSFMDGCNYKRIKQIFNDIYRREYNKLFYIYYRIDMFIRRESIIYNQKKDKCMQNDRRMLCFEFCSAKRNHGKLFIDFMYNHNKFVTLLQLKE